MKHPVLVSGAGSGIGRAIALCLAEEGFPLVLLGRNQERLSQTRAILAVGAQHLMVTADVRDARSIREGLNRAGVETFHGVVANAGIGGENQYGPEDRWDNVVQTNLTGTYYLINEALPYLKTHRKEGELRHIVVISSILARLGVPGYSAYCASKAGLLGLMRSWANTFADDGILVNAICPGWVQTDMAVQGLEAFARSSGQAYDEVFQQEMARVPLGKMSQPEEVGQLVKFLVDGRQSSLTGQTLDINNGALMP